MDLSDASVKKALSEAERPVQVLNHTIPYHLVEFERSSDLTVVVIVLVVETVANR